MILRRTSFAFTIALVAIGALVAPTNAGDLDPAQKQWIKKYEKQQNVPKAADQLLNTDAEPDLKEGFKPLFNGKDLTGWAPKGGTCLFEAKDGMIVGTCIPGSDSTYLCTEKADFKDFVFTCDMKWLVDGNSGVQFRGKIKKGKDQKGNEKETVYGPQAEMEGFSQDRHWSGGIYGQSCGGYFYPLWLKEHKEARDALKKDEWNRVTISAKGNVMKTWINGVPVAHWVDDGTYAEGFFGLQIHKGAEGKVQWRNLRIK